MLGLAAVASLAFAAPARAEPIRVVASFTILADLTRQVAGDRAVVTPLVGPDADAHVYRPSPADVKALKEARVIVVNGLGFEGFMPRLIKSSGTKAQVITATKGLDAIRKEGDDDHGHAQDHGKLDPHAWQSIEAVKRYVANIRDGLAAADPAGAATYKANADTYLTQLAALKREIETALAAIPAEKRVVITNHDAFQYLAREFNLRLESIKGVSTEAEPSAKDVARIIRLAKDKKARAVFLENMTSPKISEQIAREAGVRIGGTLYSDALTEAGGPVPSYIALMRHNAKMLVDALKE